MFTGIIEEVGRLRALRRGGPSARLDIGARKVLEGTQIGDSIAVNGVCLTVTALPPGGFEADVMHETLNRTSLGLLRPGDGVNLERAMAADGRFGGHIVAGHVDGLGRLKALRQDGNALWYQIEAGPELLRYIVEKGSVTIDGVSLTVARVGGREFAISAIPHTIEVTTLKGKGPGALLNIEVDILGKYVEKLLGGGPPGVQPGRGQSPPGGALSREFFSQNGF